MINALAVATSVPATAIIDELRALGISHVINVPDTHQRTLLAELAQRSDFQLLTACTEDEAIAINAGLWIGGQRPIVSIQHVGLLAAMNSLKGIAIGARVPTCLLVGYYGRDVTRPARENTARAIDLIEPTLDVWGVRYFPLEAPADLEVISAAYQHALDTRGPSVVLIGAPTD